MKDRPVSLRHHTACTSQVRDTIGDLYRQVRADLLEHPNYRLDVFLERLDRHGAEAGWAAVIAHDPVTGEPVGYAYGNTVTPGDRWWQRMSTPAPSRYAARTAVAVKEIGVVPASRGIGVSVRMHEELMRHRAEPHTTLMVNPAAGDGKVLRLYEGWGYREIGVVQPSPASPWLVCMARTTRPAT
ncbi:GNAT family N-acetyltransferase [Streptomyces sp. NPDC050504]|uniref:GNAT family N-acetyltransferase n=1 Tax=Streptomyces sp. NPDC050504 TaxID=3365618 RepID=UPI00378F27F7